MHEEPTLFGQCQDDQDNSQTQRKTDRESLTKAQGTLFDVAPKWTDIWRGMPEFDLRDKRPYKSLNVHFLTLEDQKEFSKLIDQKIGEDTQFVWYPKKGLHDHSGKVYVTKRQINPRYPVYVISKSRWDTRLTVKALEEISVPYHVVIEPQEFDQYRSVIKEENILVLPFSNLGQGSIPARNWVWEHALSQDVQRHWILDDNIAGFVRVNHNARTPAKTGALFRAAEDFVDRYENIALSGFNYRFFADVRCQIPPFYMNTRIYSCILIQNDIPYRWRGRYNEDTDLSLRALKDGWCTILFNAFLCNKAATMTMKGGNSDELYQDDGRLEMAESLVKQHPDVVTVTKRWGRYQHLVNYEPFKKNELKIRHGVQITDEIDDYGMELQSRTER
jgi:hypothetical protein